jgi:hypothetical protein
MYVTSAAARKDTRQWETPMSMKTNLLDVAPAPIAVGGAR